jgi:uncharacterized protein (TIGR04255 family)
MSGARHYPRAPITEAIIELRVTPREGLDIAALRQAGNSFRDYPVEGLFEATSQFEIVPGADPRASVEKRQTGYVMVDKQAGRVVQFRLNGFLFSKLAPYGEWATFRGAAHDFWSVYRQEVQPQRIEQLGVRYVNRIDIPKTKVDLREYLRTYPFLADGLPQAVGGYFMQLSISMPELPGQMIINQAGVPPARDGETAILLDIDIFSNQDVPQDDPAIWEFFEELHRRKNDVFEACITDSARKLFD